MEPRYQQLMWRLTLTGLAVTLIPLYVTGAAIYLYFASVQEQNQRAQLHNLALNRANAVQLFLAERISMLEVLAQTASLDLLTSPGELGEILDILNQRQHSFVDLGIIDANGDHVAYEGPYRLEDRNYGGEPWFEETMLRGVYVSDVFLGFRGVPHFVIAIRRDDRSAPWVLRATIDSEVFTRLVRSGQIGLTGNAYIVNRAGQYQTPPRFGGEILGQAPFSPSIAPPGVNVVFREDEGGRRVMTAFAWMTSKDWLLVIDRDPSEPAAPLRQALRIELMALVIASLLVGGAVIFHTRQLVGRLADEDRKRVATEAQLAHSARLVSLGRMAAGVAHEINNPLAAIGELAGLMEDLIDDQFLRSVPHAALFQDNVRKIQTHVDRTRDITHRLLGFARRMEPHHDSVNVNDVAREALTFIEREASFRQVELVRELDPDLPIITSDRAQLQQVVLNLLNNALDAVSEGGRIVVSSRPADDGVEVAVADNGTGIPEELHDRIFDPFFTTKAPGEGSGLGLSICHTIMKGLGGTLSFSSALGRGTTFRVRLPRSSP
ncbi:MAG TPA: ATP-binding protein [Candidatus Sulfomarinibacteraceae bacterium]|nr:ATP-binding protein [Candidatus Sulfomarinibacteraceae bacterium]